jgi:hypothetical protein
MRLEKEDLEAFHKVQEATGGPTETQFLDLCRENYRDFEPRSRERAVIPEPDIRRNAAILWKALWNHELDIEREITRKVEEILHKDWYGYDPNLKEELKSVIRPRKAPE